MHINKTSKNNLSRMHTSDQFRNEHLTANIIELIRLSFNNIL